MDVGRRSIEARLGGDAKQCLQELVCVVLPSSLELRQKRLHVLVEFGWTDWSGEKVLLFRQGDGPTSSLGRVSMSKAQRAVCSGGLGFNIKCIESAIQIQSA